MAETTPEEHALAFLRELRDLCDRYAARLRAPEGRAAGVGLANLVVDDAGLTCDTGGGRAWLPVRLDFGRVQREA